MSKLQIVGVVLVNNVRYLKRARLLLAKSKKRQNLVKKREIRSHMGANNCCVREKSSYENKDICDINLRQQQPASRPSYSQFLILEKLSHFNPRKNALPVALTHLLQDGCQGLMRSLPLLMEVSEIYAPKGDQSHYFDPQILMKRFGVREYVSTGNSFTFNELGKAFQQELQQFQGKGLVQMSSASWSVILILKVSRRTHSFSIKKRNGWEYVLHTLYELTEEELKEEQERILKHKNLRKEKQSNPLLQHEPSNEDQQLLFSEESTLQDEIITPDTPPIQLDQTIVTRPSAITQRQSTRSSYTQVNPNLTLGDMAFKGYNCGEVCFSPYEVFLEYLNSISEEYIDIKQQTIQPNSSPKDTFKGFMQLIIFVKEKDGKQSKVIEESHIN